MSEKRSTGRFTINTIRDGRDGESAPYYFAELFAWSNEATTVNNTTSPFGNNTEPNPAWQSSIPANPNGLAYLWCKQTKYTWNDNTRQYVAGTPQYYRRSGTNGTSIKIKGSIDVIVASGDLPTYISGGPSGWLGIALNSSTQSRNKIYVSLNRYTDAVSWEDYATAADGDSYTIIRDNTLSINGEPSENKKGHLIQWLAEAGVWQDLGAFQGQAGKTYYTHVAWADNVTLSGSTLPIPSGQTTRPNATAVTGGTTSPSSSGKLWMGILVDETVADSTTYTNYTWSKVRGDDAWTFDVQPAAMTWGTDENGKLDSYTGQGGVARAYKGSTLQTTTDIIAVSGLPLGFTFATSSNNGFSITPHEYYTTFVHSGTTVYLMKRLNQYDVNDNVYDASMMKIGTVSAVDSGGITVTYDTGGSEYYIRSGGEVHVLLTAPVLVTLTLQSGSVIRNTELTLVPNKRGVDGDDGDDGRGITSTNIYYKAFDTTPTSQDYPSGVPGGSGASGWVDNGNTLIIEGNASKHLYESTCTTYDDGTYSWTTPLDDGLISDMAATEEEYGLSDSNSTYPSSWSTTQQPTAGKWIWSRTKLTFKDNSTKYLPSANGQCIGYCGTNGTPGNPGADAIYLDLINEHDAIQYAGTTKVGGNATTQAVLRKGGQPVTGVTYSVFTHAGIPDNASGQNDAFYINQSTGAAEVKKLNAIKGLLIITTTYNGVDYYATFTVDKLVDKPKYEIKSDKDIVAFNTSNSPSTQSANVNIYIYKNAIDQNGNAVKTLVGDLDDEGLYLYCEYSKDGEYTDMTDDYYEVLETGVMSNKTSLTTYLCATEIGQGETPYSSALQDVETIPVVTVQNGQKGDKGDAARQPYEWGRWEDFVASNSNTFTANKFEAPYFIVTEEYEDQNHVTRIGERKWLWVGEDGEYVPPLATPGTGQKRATTPSNNDPNWTLMVTDFKYLISEAMMADYGKFGAGIFSKDYAFSQYGRIDGDGSDIDHYKNFRPEFFKGTAYTMFSGSKVIDSQYFDSLQNAFELGSLFLENGITYTFTITGTITKDLRIQVVRVRDGASISTWYHTSSTPVTSLERPINFSIESNDYTVLVYSESGQSTITGVSVKASKAFRPNFYIDWLKGEVYGQLGHFVNVIVEGVLNNLMQTINADNIDNYGFTLNAWSDAAGNSYGKTFFLNPLKVGSYVKIDMDGIIQLPCACCCLAGYDSETQTDIYEDHVFDGGKDVQNIYRSNGLTFDDLRQCIGKKLYVMPYDTNEEHSYKFMCGGVKANFVNELLVRKFEYFPTGVGVAQSPDLKYIGISTTPSVEYSRYYLTNIEYFTSIRFYILECKLGMYNSKECIYWEMKDAGSILTAP